jgi:hypothetical protein
MNLHLVEKKSFLYKKDEKKINPSWNIIMIRERREKKKLFYFISFLTLRPSSNVEKKIWWVRKTYREMTKRILIKSTMLAKKFFEKEKNKKKKK